MHTHAYILMAVPHKNQPKLLKCWPWEALGQDAGRFVFSSDLV